MHDHSCLFYWYVFSKVLSKLGVRRTGTPARPQPVVVIRRSLAPPVTVRGRAGVPILHFPKPNCRVVRILRFEQLDFDFNFPLAIFLAITDPDVT